MNKLHDIHIEILKTKITLRTENPDEIKALVAKLEEILHPLVTEYVGWKTDCILIFACLRILEENQKHIAEITSLINERELLNKSLQNVLNNLN